MAAAAPALVLCAVASLGRWTGGQGGEAQPLREVPKCSLWLSLEAELCLVLPSHLAALLVASLEDEFCKKCWEASEMLRVEKSPLSAPTHLWIESHSPGSQLLQNHQVWEGSQIHHQWTLFGFGVLYHV